MKVFYVTLYLLFVLSLTAKAQDSVKVALVQAHLAWGDVDANLRDFDKRVRSCKGCDMIVFPELFTSGCEMKKRDKEEAVCSKDGVASYYPLVIKRMRKWAKRSGALVVGSTIYKEEGKYYNRLLAVYPDGKYEYYDKHNCFKKGSFSPGDRHLEWSRNHGEYDVAIYIANWPESRRDDWNRLLRERAIENEAYVIAVNCAGADLTGLMYRGESCVIAPDGEVRAKCRDYRDDIVVYKVMK